MGSFKLSLSYISPPLAVLFCGKPFTMLVTPPWWAMLMPLFAVICHAVPPLPWFFMLLWAWPWVKSKKFALMIVNNHLQDKRFEGLKKSKKMAGSIRSTRTPSRLQLPPAVDRGPVVGMNGTEFQKK